MPINDPNLAGDADAGTFTPVTLWAGESEVVTEPGVVLTTQGVIAAHTVVARNTAGKWVLHAPAAGDVTANAAGITTARIDTTGGDVNLPIYTSGFFNQAALVWNAATSTDALKQAAFARTTIKVGKVRQ